MTSLTLREAETFKCALCDNYLSLPPIYIISSDGLEQKCGRCADISTPLSIRNVGYENIAKYVSFPCIFRGCTKKIPWKDVWKHETECALRSVQCPIYWERCNYVVKVRELRHHFGRFHKKHLFYDKVVGRLETGSSNVFLLIKNDMQFLVYITTKVRIERTFIAIFSLQPTGFENNNYKIKLTSRSKPHFHMTIKNQQIIPYNENKYCRRCVGRDCRLMYHRYSLENESKEYEVLKNMTTKINIAPIGCMFQSDHITYTITITEAESFSAYLPRLENSKSKDEATETFDPNQFFRQCLECPVCREYMEAPIFICQTGHAICNICKPKLENCPICKVNIGESRNYSLESIAESVEVRCANDDLGCSFVGTVREIQHHELVCDYNDSSTIIDNNNKV